MNNVNDLIKSYIHRYNDCEYFGMKSCKMRNYYASLTKTSLQCVVLFFTNSKKNHKLIPISSSPITICKATAKTLASEIQNQKLSKVKLVCDFQ